MRQQSTGDTLLAAGARSCRGFLLYRSLETSKKRGAQHEELSPPPHAYDPAIGLRTNRESTNAHSRTRIDHRASGVSHSHRGTWIDHGPTNQSTSNSHH